MAVSVAELQSGLATLDNLARAEYGTDLGGILTDPNRDEADRLWRIGRLIGITIKEPFATPVSIDPSSSVTGSRRAWLLNEDSFDLVSNRATWQYRTLKNLVTDRDLRTEAYLGPDAWAVAASIFEDFRGARRYRDANDLANFIEWNFGITDEMGKNKALKSADEIIRGLSSDFFDGPEPLARCLQEQLSTELVKIAAREFQSERGFFRCLGLSSARYICGDPKLKADIDQALSHGGGSPKFASPQTMMGAGAALAATTLIHAIPPLAVVSVPVLTGFLLLVFFAECHASPREKIEIFRVVPRCRVRASNWLARSAPGLRLYVAPSISHREACTVACHESQDTGRQNRYVSSHRSVVRWTDRLQQHRC
jgi:hypothetical protein